MRLFVAVPIPAEVRAEMTAWVPRAAALVGDAVRWNPPEQWHLTVVFLGEVPDESLPTVIAAGNDALSDAAALTLQMRGGGRFGDRVLWAGLAAGGLVALSGRLRDRLRAAGIGFDDKPFRPHLTLARARSGRSVDLRPAAAALADFTGSVWTARGVDLVRSRLGAGPDRGALHETVHTWPLL